MPCIKAETIYTGNDVIRDAYLHLDGERITGISQQAQGTEEVPPRFLS